MGALIIVDEPPAIEMVLAVGQIAQYLSYGSAFAFSGAILLAAAVFWIFAPETRPKTNAEHTEARPLGPDAGGDVP